MFRRPRARPSIALSATSASPFWKTPTTSEALEGLHELNFCASEDPLPADRRSGIPCRALSGASSIAACCFLPLAGFDKLRSGSFVNFGDGHEGLIQSSGLIRSARRCLGRNQGNEWAPFNVAQAGSLRTRFRRGGSNGKNARILALRYRKLTRSARSL